MVSFGKAFPSALWRTVVLCCVVLMRSVLYGAAHEVCSLLAGRQVDFHGWITFLAASPGRCRHFETGISPQIRLYVNIYAFLFFAYVAVTPWASQYWILRPPFQPSCITTDKPKISRISFLYQSTFLYLIWILIAFKRSIIPFL